jgi:hypothetical protein
MALALGHLDASYGGVVGYLRLACGLTDDEIGAVRDRLITRRPGCQSAAR